MQNNTMKKWCHSLTQQTHTKNLGLERTDRACFSHLLRHPARKRSGSILTTLEPARGLDNGQCTTRPKRERRCPRLVNVKVKCSVKELIE